MADDPMTSGEGGTKSAIPNVEGGAMSPMPPEFEPSEAADQSAADVPHSDETPHPDHFAGPGEGEFFAGALPSDHKSAPDDAQTANLSQGGIDFTREEGGRQAQSITYAGHGEYVVHDAAPQGPEVQAAHVPMSQRTDVVSGVSAAEEMWPDKYAAPDETPEAKAALAAGIAADMAANGKPFEAPADPDAALHGEMIAMGLDPEKVTELRAQYIRLKEDARRILPEGSSEIDVALFAVRLFDATK